MEIKEKFFHTLMPYGYGTREEELEEELWKLECILKCGYILPYKDISKLYPNTLRHKLANNNGDDKISICRHAFGPLDEEDKKYIKENRYGLMEFGFEQFPGQEMAIVLNESLQKDFKLITYGMYLEKQVAGPIPLTYMDAISIPPTKEIQTYFSTPDHKEMGIYSENYFTLDFLIKVSKLLEKYGYNIPIVSVLTGYMFHNPYKKEDNSQADHLIK